MNQLTTYPVYTKDNFAWDTFLHHAEHYLNLVSNSADPDVPKALRPRFSATSHLAVPKVNFENIEFTFTDAVLDDFIQNADHTNKKDFTASLTYGYRGYSPGQKNGIVLMRDEDDRLLRRYDKFMKANAEDIAEKYGIGKIIGEEKPHALEGVKLVCHRKNGLRTIGVRDAVTNHVLFFDRMNYKA